ncbi:hypothetical protein SISSUDRAFT_979067 [Sistotremastrum suecicum HHB10207 ss-3]|uniref:Vacuole protein n=1 Tax=Sistotremastrum suecicum HHB10207 ss-3 TaxID=1314776 RepID=A0A166HSG2_9AGAM|nr:hypothetical protein SISSUDRAFT_979067 [Sistotremastrum suecicum HHB10207 ss-3]
MCFTGPAWKREVVPDHKFDFVDTRDFHSKSFGIRMRYLWVYILVVKSFLVYVSDIFTSVTMLTTHGWSNTIFQSCPQTETNGCVFIPFDVGKWLFVGCIIFSFLLLAYEARKAKKIIASRDISYAFTNVMAQSYYSLRSYDHFCFFCHISDSTKKKDDFAFFIFFTFKGWKRLLLADGPRQSINALTLYSFYLAKKDDGSFWDFSKYSDDLITSGLIISTLFTVLIFAGSLLMLIVAGICYIPLLCYIQGNLKEYCCHKVDKRIAEIVKRKNKQRLAKAAALARKEAAGDFSHLKNKKGEFIANPLPQPTLPNVFLEDIEKEDKMSMRTRVEPNPNGYPQTVYKDYSYNPGPANSVDPNSEYPPMPAYYSNPHQHHYQPDHYAASTATLPDDGTLYENDQGSYNYADEYAVSHTHLTAAAAPVSGYQEAAYPPPLHNPHSAGIEGSFPRDHYATTNRGHDLEVPRRHSRPISTASGVSGLAYDHDYGSEEAQPSGGRYR